MPAFRPATREDCHLMAPNLRPDDLAELVASTDLPPLEALLYSLDTTPETWACVDDDGQPFALYGTGLEDGYGSPWMLGTDGIERHWRWFLRNTPRIIADVSRGHPLLYNAVDARNTVHVRWLSWAGFTVLPDPVPGPKGLPFLQFYMRSQCAS